MASSWLFKTEPSDYAFEDLVRITRLSVMPVPAPLWGELIRMSAT